MNETYQLFHSETCGFCHRVRDYMTRSGWEIPLRNIMFDSAARQELIAGGGRAMVPCLRIERDAQVTWLYESLDIMDFLESRRVLDS
jgi:glutathione S-transferase